MGCRFRIFRSWSISSIQDTNVNSSLPFWNGTKGKSSLLRVSILFQHLASVAFSLNVTTTMSLGDPSEYPGKA